MCFIFLLFSIIKFEAKHHPCNTESSARREPTSLTASDKIHTIFFLLWVLTALNSYYKCETLDYDSVTAAHSRFLDLSGSSSNVAKTVTKFILADSCRKKKKWFLRVECNNYALTSLITHFIYLGLSLHIIFNFSVLNIKFNIPLHFAP